MDQPLTRAKSRLSATPERSILKLKPAFRPPKRPPASTRAASLGTEIAVNPVRTRRLRVRWQEEGSTVQDISRDLDLLEEVVDGLKRRVSPMEEGKSRVEVRRELVWVRRQEEGSVVPVKWTKPRMKVLSNAPIHSELGKFAALLYKPRFETSEPPVVKASKPRTTRPFPSLRRT